MNTVLEETIGRDSCIIDHIDGNLMYLEGAEFPFRGVPNHEAIHACNIVKKIVLHALKTLSWRLLLVPKEKLIKSFNLVAWEIMEPHILEPDQMIPVARECRELIEDFISELGIEDAGMTANILSHLIEYDGAYRFRIQDMFQVLCKFWVKGYSPYQCIKRTKYVILKRERKDYARHRMDVLMTAISLLVLIPKYKKAFKVALTNVNWWPLYLDEADLYWTAFRKDYRFGGKEYEERQQYIKDKGYSLPVVDKAT